MKTTDIFLDLSRILLRSKFTTPTGIDRVELAYAKYFIDCLPTSIKFVCRSYGFIGMLPRNWAVEFIRMVDLLWAGAETDEKLHVQVVQLSFRLRLSALLYGGLSLHL